MFNRPPAHGNPDSPVGVGVYVLVPPPPPFPNPPLITLVPDELTPPPHAPSIISAVTLVVRRKEFFVISSFPIFPPQEGIVPTSSDREKLHEHLVSESVNFLFFCASADVYFAWIVRREWIAAAVCRCVLFRELVEFALRSPYGWRPQDVFIDRVAEPIGHISHAIMIVQIADILSKYLDALTGDRQVILKLTLPVEPERYADLVGHPRVARVMALSGGYSRSEACDTLAKNHGVIASFSRALLADLQHDMDDVEFDNTLKSAIEEIYLASTEKR